MGSWGVELRCSPAPAPLPSLVHPLLLQAICHMVPLKPTVSLPWGPTAARSTWCVMGARNRVKESRDLE